MPTTTDLHPALRQELVNELIPHMATQQERQAKLHLALPNAAYRRIDFHGAADVFTANMVDSLFQYGEIAPGKQAIVAVLDVIHAQVGLNNQRTIERLQQKLLAHFQNVGLIFCPRCNGANRTTARFCLTCGQTLTQPSGSGPSYAFALLLQRLLKLRFFRTIGGLGLIITMIWFGWMFARQKDNLASPAGATATIFASSPTVLATVMPSPTIPATPGAVATEIVSTPTALATAIPTIRTIPATAFTAVAMPTATRFVDCALLVAPEFTDTWHQAEMGCPLSAGQVVWASWTPFEHGHMMWRRDTNTIYVFYNSGQWQATPDVWDEVSEPPSRGTPPAGRHAPKRGTGWVWGNDEAVFQGLGWATAEQKGFCAEVQAFEHGFILQSSQVEFCHEEKLYNFAREATFGVLSFKAYNTGYWQR